MTFSDTQNRKSLTFTWIENFATFVWHDSLFLIYYLGLEITKPWDSGWKGNCLVSSRCRYVNISNLLIKNSPDNDRQHPFRWPKYQPSFLCPRHPIVLLGQQSLCSCTSLSTSLSMLGNCWSSWNDDFRLLKFLPTSSLLLCSRPITINLTTQF